MSRILRSGLTAEYRVIRELRYRCAFCGVGLMPPDTHPQGVVFINGYPAPCSYMGQSVVQEIKEHPSAPCWVEAIPIAARLVYRPHNMLFKQTESIYDAE